LLTSSVAVASAKKNLKYVDPDVPCKKKWDPLTAAADVVKTPLEDVELPETFVWNDVKGRNYLTNMRN